MSLHDPALQSTLTKDKVLLEKTKLPIITVSASFREDIKGYHGYTEDESIPDVVFSRAHFSMAVGVAVQAWGFKDGILTDAGIRPEKAWIVDPTNYVSHADWKRIEFTQFVGQTLARNDFLKKLKDLIDQFARSKLPILKSITPPLIDVTTNVHRPILSLHIAAGNILASHGKKVVQVITDPHVRAEYLTHAEKPNVYFCVFDQNTKTEFLEKAAIHHKQVDPSRVIVTGPPIDPRIVSARQKKVAWRSGRLNLCITTGGLGTNKEEIRTLLEQLIPELRKRSCPFQLMIYAGTQEDICDMVRQVAKRSRITIHPPEDDDAKLRLLYHPQIVDANELLITYGFPWADGFITKPSGDMAYDAVAAGCFLLTLKEWGVWEHNIREVFEQREISRPAEVEHIIEQLAYLTKARKQSNSWVERAMNHAFEIDKLFLKGSQHIIEVVEALD
jgi:hypothetical protein